MKELILGGVRSGKSRLAEQRARDTGRQILYIATAIVGSDTELDERIRQHRLRRPATWSVVEEPLALGQALRAHASTQACLVVECLTLWLTNLLCIAPDRFERERLSLLDTLPTLAGDIILVSNETGLGVVPLGVLSRRFVDASGELHQSLAMICHRVTLAVAGLPFPLKGTHP
jgi:adenosylcobinamide kinase/adenosylcobinamide-phosphate guanylyltransferase